MKIYRQIPVYVLAVLAIVTFGCEETDDANSLIQFNLTFGGEAVDYGRWLLEANDGGYIIAGETRSFGTGGDVLLIKTDEKGNEEWNKTYGGAEKEAPYAITPTSDGGYIITGETESIGEGKADVWVLKIDASGNEEWNTAFGGSRYELAFSIQQTLDGGYITTGVHSSNTFSSDNTWLIKLDAVGDSSWAIILETDGMDRGRSVQQTDDGGYILTAVMEEEYALIKTDPSGSVEWSKKFGVNHGGAERNSAIKTIDGGYIIAPVLNRQPTLIKLDSAGETEWSTAFGNDAHEDISSLQLTEDGGYIAAGSIYSQETGTDAWLVKFDDQGNMEWSKSFAGSSEEVAECAYQTSDGGYVLTGKTHSVGAGYYDIFLIKTDESGNAPQFEE